MLAFSPKNIDEMCNFSVHKHTSIIFISKATEREEESRHRNVLVLTKLDELKMKGMFALVLLLYYYTRESGWEECQKQGWRAVCIIDLLWNCIWSTC